MTIDNCTKRILEMDTTKMAPYICDLCDEQCDLDMEAYRFDKTNIIVLCSKCVHKLYEQYLSMEKPIGQPMEWTQFKDKMPERNDHLLICGKINTDPLEISTKNTCFDLVYYSYGLILSECDDYQDYEPDPEDYWMYLDDIPTPYLFT